MQSKRTWSNHLVDREFNLGASALIAGQFLPRSAKIPNEFVGTIGQLKQDCAESEQPVALLIACSELGFQVDSVSGFAVDDFVCHQNFGNTVARFDSQRPDESLIYWLQSEAIGHVIVCGHTCCRRFSQCTNLLAGKDYPQYIEEGAAMMRRIKQLHPESPPFALPRISAFESTIIQTHHLTTYPTVTAKVERGVFKLHAWVLDDSNHRVMVYKDGRFVDSQHANARMST